MEHSVWKLCSIHLILVIVFGSSLSRSEDNVALNKPTFMLSEANGGVKERAVDADPSTYSHTDNTAGVRQFLVVDLQSYYFIRKVSVKEHSSGPHGRFEILVGDDFNPNNMEASLQQFRFCAEVGAVTDPPEYLDLNCRSPGRFVAIRRYQEATYLVISDFRVFGDVQQQNSNYDHKTLTTNLLTKDAYRVSEVAEAAGNIIDGNSGSGTLIKADTLYFVAAMDQTNAVHTVHITFSSAVQSFTVLVGYKWSTCRLRLSDFSVCAAMQDNADKVVKVACKIPIAGLFVAVAFQSQSGSDNLNEIKAYGTAAELPMSDSSVVPSSCEIADAPMNIAKGKKGYGSSVYSSSYMPHKALDGNPSGNANDCFFTKSEKDGWFVVDLEGYYDIQEVRFWARNEWWTKNEVQNTFKNLVISIGQTFRPCVPNAFEHFKPCYTQTYMPWRRPITTGCQGYGRYVALQILDITNYLGLCEMEVFGTLRGKVTISPTWQDACEFQPTNLATNKQTYYVKESSIKTSKKLTQGTLPVCDWLTTDHKYIIVDLQKTAWKPFVRLWPWTTLSLSRFDLYIGNSWSSCQPDDIDDFEFCGQLIMINGIKFYEGLCYGSGRFVALKPVGEHSGDWLCELEVFGDTTDAYEEPNYKTSCDALVNVARGKSVQSSSVAWNGVPERAVDGNADGVFNNGHCMYTACATNQWLEIDLGGVYDIEEIRLWSRKESFAVDDVKDLFKKIHVSIGTQTKECQPEKNNFRTCFAGVQNMTSYRPFLTGCSGIGRYVNVRVEGDACLVLCEVEVFGKLKKQSTAVSPAWKDTCSVLKEQSKAYQKSAFLGHSAPTAKTKATDGNKDSELWTTAGKRSWIVIDLQETYAVQLIRLFNLKGDGVQDGIEVHIGNQWLPCLPDQVDGFKKCADVRKSQGYVDEVLCSSMQGRFIALRTKGDKSFGVGEVEMFTDQAAIQITDHRPKWMHQCDLITDDSNVAKQKKAYSSSTGWNGVPSRGVDGNTAGVYNDGFCMCTNEADNQYYVIDLGGVYEIENIRLWQRSEWYKATEVANMMKTITVSIGDEFHCGTFPNFQVCYQNSDTSDLTRPIYTSCQGRGRYVALRQTVKSFILMCEVEVFGKLVGEVAASSPWDSCELQTSLSLASDKTAFVFTPSSDAVTTENKIVDEATSTCFELKENGQYIMIDLGKPVENAIVKVWTNFGIEHHNTNQTYEILTGDNWLSCRPDSIQFFRPCGKITSTGKQYDITKCIGEGRYIAVKGVKISRAPICQVEVFGNFSTETPQALPEQYTTCDFIATNIAKGKKAYSPQVSYGGVPSRAVDGDISGTYNDRHCMYSAHASDNWLVIDLGDIYEIETVRLWRRTDWWVNADIKLQMENLTISVGTGFSSCRPSELDQFDECAKITSMNWKIPIFKECIGVGRYISIRQNAVGNALILCEVEVSGKLASTIQSSEPDWRQACDLESSSNVAKAKPAFAVGKGSVNQAKVTDGSDSVFSVKANERTWIVVDLEAIQTISLVRIFGLSTSTTPYTLEVRVGSEWLPCRQGLIDTFIKCGEISEPSGKVDEVICPKIKARYVAVLSKRGTSGEINLALSELQVFAEGDSTAITNAGDPVWKGSCDLVNNDASNIAYQKPAYRKAGSAEAVVNGDGQSKCSWVGDNDFIVIDLQDVYEVAAVRILGRSEYWLSVPKRFEVRLLRTFHPCRLQNLRTGTLCASVGENDDNLLTLECGAVGQFVAINFIDPGSLKICEVEVFGEKKEGMTPIKVFPDRLVLNGAMPAVPNIHGEIVDAEMSVAISEYAGEVIAVSAASQPILVHPKNREDIFLVASTLGSGRVLAAGRGTPVFKIVKNDDIDFWRKAVRWLTKGKEPAFIDAESVTTAESVTSAAGSDKGAVVLWHGYSGVTSEVADIIKNLVKTGAASLFFGVRGVTYKKLSVGNFEDILSEAGIAYRRWGYSSWGQQTWSTNLTDDFGLSLENRLYKALSSEAYFYAHGKDIIERFNDLPAKVLEVANLKEKIMDIINKFEVYSHAVAPCRSHYPSDGDIQDFLTVYGAALLSPVLAHSGIRAPNTDYFPGAVPPNSPRVTVTLEVITTITYEQHATGLYLPPGGTLTWELVDEASQALVDHWEVGISCHTDDISRQPSWYRFPYIRVKQPLSRGRIFSAFGGVVWLVGYQAGKIRIKISGAVKTPYFNLRDPTNIAAWDTARSAPGPWAEIAGDAMVYCVPSEHVRKFNASYVENLMKKVPDTVVKSDHHLRGTNWKTSRRQRFSLDVQISSGSGHSGYPIMAYLNWWQSLLDYDHIQKHGSWGLFHEVGHNMQRGLWTFYGADEVTNNLMALYNRHLLGMSFFKNYSRFDGKRDYFKTQFAENSGYNFAKWKSEPYLALTIYAQLAEHFTFAIFKKAFRMYIDENIKPSNNAEKMEQWIITTSKAAGYNLAPLYDFWDFTITDKIKQDLSGLTPFLPDDLVIQQGPERAQSIIAKYSGVVREAQKLEDPYEDEMSTFNDILPNDVIVS